MNKRALGQPNVKETTNWLKFVGILKFSFLLFLLSTKLFAQPNTVSGRITDSAGTALPGVSVLVKGSKNGTTTNPQGEFQLRGVPARGTLVTS